MAGYSPRSLVDKLGIKESHRVLLIQAPTDYDRTLGPLPGVDLSRATFAPSPRAKMPFSLSCSASLAKHAPFDFIQGFCGQSAELESLLPVAKSLLAMDGMLWVSWRKKIKGAKFRAAAVMRERKTGAGSGTKTTQLPLEAEPLGENRVRELGLAIGLVDVKVCAVDNIWSGLKFRFRRKDRPE